jgi:hypothetical protein
VDTWSDAQLVSLEGHAVKAFLQGYLTCNSDRIEKNTPTPMTLCNLKGRVVANGWALGDDAQVLLVVHRTVGRCTGGFSEALCHVFQMQGTRPAPSRAGGVKTSV